MGAVNSVSSATPWVGSRPQFRGLETGRRHTRVDVRAGIFKQGMQKVLGADVDPEVEARIANGTMTFYDFLKASQILNRMQSMAGMARNLPGMKGKIPSKEQLNAAQRKMNSFKKIIDAMEEDERV